MRRKLKKLNARKTPHKIQRRLRAEELIRMAKETIERIREESNNK